MKDQTPEEIIDGWLAKTGGYAKDMMLRDYFAAKAMLPLMGHSGGYWTEANLAAYANTAYAMADAMLKAREA